MRGVVHDLLGLPIAGARVTLAGVGQENIRDTRSDSRGTFTFLDLPTGPYALDLESPGFHRTVIAPISVSPGEHKLLPPLPMDIEGPCGHGGWSDTYLPYRLGSDDAAGGIFGIVLDQGQVMKDVHVSLICGSDYECGSTKTDALGRFGFKNLAPGVYGVRVLRRGFYPEERIEWRAHEGLDLTYTPINLERCVDRGCDPKKRPRKPIRICE